MEPKILLFEDDTEYKLPRTLEYIKNVLGDDVDITISTDVATGTRLLLKENEFTHIIVDMQMPQHDGEFVDREAGIQILTNIFHDDALEINENIKVCVNSSSDSSLKKMETNGFTDIQFIENSSMYDCTSDFKKFFDV